MTNEEIVALAESKGLAVRPTRTGKTYVFFVRRDSELLFDGRALCRDEVVNWLKTQEKP